VDRCFEFTGSNAGPWRVLDVRSIIGDAIASAPALAIAPAGLSSPRAPGAWSLRGVISNIRYAAAVERDTLTARQAGLGRSEALCAALIPIRKNPAWWALAQDERRAIMEEQSHHITIGLDYLPAVARKLYHCRDIGEPFDFLTWFEFAPEHAGHFDDLLVRLRASHEWSYVDREVEMRLERAG
jgi:Chlorite dismutase